MKQKHTGKKRRELLRWTLNMAEQEFGIAQEQLDKRRRQLEIEAGKDGCFTSQQIAAMMFGDKEAEVIGKIKAEREKTEVEGQHLRQERIPLEIVERATGEAFGAIAAILKSHRGKVLDDLTIEDCNSAMRDVPKKLKWMK